MRWSLAHFQQRSFSVVAAGAYHNLALKNDGTVVAWGDNDWGQSDVPAGLSGVTAVAAGYFHSLAVADASSAARARIPMPGIPSPTRGT